MKRVLAYAAIVVTVAFLVYMFILDVQVTLDNGRLWERVTFLTGEVETQWDQIKFLMYKECLSERTDYYHWRTFRDNRIKVTWEDPGEGECRYDFDEIRGK